jgi:hypothetical protein
MGRSTRLDLLSDSSEIPSGFRVILTEEVNGSLICRPKLT